MKRILMFSILMLLVFQLAACGVSETKNTMSNVSPIEPEKPKNTTEKIQYMYLDGKVTIIKGYFDSKNNCVEEQHYTFDGKLNIFDCTAISYNTYNRKGELVEAEMHYKKNPVYFVKETVLNLEAIKDGKYDYKTEDSGGNILLYIKETKDGEGRVTKNEYYDAGDRLLKTEEMEYNENGTLSSHKMLNAKNEISFASKYNSDGNLTSFEGYDDFGRLDLKGQAKYYENGIMSEYTLIPVGEDGGYGIATKMKFHEDGRMNTISHRNSIVTRYSYDENGVLKSVDTNYEGEYIFDENGFVTKYRGYIVGNMMVQNTVDTCYFYKDGVLVKTNTVNNANKKTADASYTLKNDGTAIIELTEIDTFDKIKCWLDKNGRVVKEETTLSTGRIRCTEFEYDTLGNLVKETFTDNGKKSKMKEYRYDIHNAVIREDETSYYSSSENKEYVLYEYYDNGYPKNITRYDRLDNIDYSYQYAEDGSYTYTLYDELGRVSSKTSFDKYGKEK